MPRAPQQNAPSSDQRGGQRARHKPWVGGPPLTYLDKQAGLATSPTCTLPPLTAEDAMVTP